MPLLPKQKIKKQSKIASFFSHFKKPSPRKVVVFVALLTFSLILLNPDCAFAYKVVAPMPQNYANAFANLFSVGTLSVPILQAIAYALSQFVDVAANVLGFMLRSDLYNFAQEPIIKYGWTIMRDVCNIFFLLALLFIAFCTILQVEKYHAKKTLLTLIIMALLINFSKPIAIFIFDGSQLLMNYFLNANQNYQTTVTGISKIADVIYKDLPSFFDTLIKYGGASAAARYIFAIVFLFMYGVALFILAIYLLIRIVALWMLIIVSPIAFLAAIIPDFKKISSDWWNALFKYSYVGPAIAFFLLISTKLDESHFRDLASKVNDTSKSVVSLQNFIPFITVLVFLYASIIMAQKFGIAFAGAITSRANQFMKWAGKGVGYRMPKWAASRTGIPGAVRQKVESVPFAKRWLTKEGWKESLEDRQARMAERMGVKGAGEKLKLKRMAELNKKWKDEGILDDHDALRSMLHSGNELQRMTAGRELVKEGKIKDAKDYEAGLNAFSAFPALRKAFETNAKKKNINAVIGYEVKKAGATTAPAIQAVYDRVLGSIKPVDIADQNVKALKNDKYFKNFANHPTKGFGAMPASIRNELAKKLNAADLADFQLNGWI